MWTEPRTEPLKQASPGNTVHIRVKGPGLEAELGKGVGRTNGQWKGATEPGGELCAVTLDAVQDSVNPV